MSRSDLKAAAIRALRTAIQVGIAVYPIDRLIGYAAGTDVLDVSLLRKAAVVGIASGVAFLWRAFVDPTKVPSLRDPDQAS